MGLSKKKNNLQIMREKLVDLVDEKEGLDGVKCEGAGICSNVVNKEDKELRDKVIKPKLKAGRKKEAKLIDGRLLLTT